MSRLKSAISRNIRQRHVTEDTSVEKSSWHSIRSRNEFVWITLVRSDQLPASSSLIIFPTMSEKRLPILSDPEETLPRHMPHTVRAWPDANPAVIHPHIKLSPSHAPHELAFVLGRAPHVGSEAPSEVLPKLNGLRSQRTFMAATLEAAHLDLFARNVVVDVHVSWTGGSHGGWACHHHQERGSDHGKLRHVHFVNLGWISCRCLIQSA